jgi:predicted lipoprotein
VALVAGCRELRRTAALEGLVREVAVPGYKDLAARSEQLVDATNHLAGHPDAAALEAAQERWRDAMADWKRTFVFRQGALIAAAPHFRAAYAAVEPQRIADAIADPHPVDAAFVRELGTSSKGMFALQLLLFGGPGDTPNPLTALTVTGGERRAAFMHQLAVDIAARATDAARTTATPDFVAGFARAGQASVNRLVNDLAAVVEDVVTSRLGMVVAARDAGTLAANPVEGQASGTSQRLTLALLRGVAALYRGGLGTLVRAASPEADRATDAALTRALASVEAIGAPLEQAVVANREGVVKATADVRALEVALKTQVAGALGVTLTFTAGDGD